MVEPEDLLNAVLSDPEQMGRIAAMASKLMGSIAPEQSAPTSGNGEGSLTELVGRVMGSMQGDGKRKALLQGLAPYLTEPRRARLARALKLASAAKLAGAAFRSMGGEED